VEDGYVSHHSAARDYDAAIPLAASETQSANPSS
jgi:hypothetical protein